MEHIVIGIEGLVGAGKTSVCRELLKRIPNSVLLNGGNLYRAIVYAMMKNGVDIKKVKNQAEKIDIKTVMDLFKISLKIEDQETKIYMDGQIIDEEKIQSQTSSIAVSMVGGSANNEGLFQFARNLIESLKVNYNIIISGRSIMNIYPQTDYHFFLIADLDERVRRKSIQYNGEVDFQELKKHIEERDNLQKQAGFYELHDKTKVIDVTNCKSIEESTNCILENIKLPSEII